MLNVCEICGQVKRVNFIKMNNGLTMLICDECEMENEEYNDERVNTKDLIEEMDYKYSDR